MLYLMATVQLPGSKWFDTQHGRAHRNKNTDVSLAKEFQKKLSNE